MGRCSYAWKEWDSERDEFVERQCPRESWEGSDEFCIFHDPSQEKDVDLFKKRLEEQLRSETDMYCFIGYSFPEGGCNFENYEFTADAYFREATFQDVNFREATFQGNANFWRATFQDASFMEATFQDANFREATFRNAYFDRGTFQGNADFRGADFRNTDFWGTTFKDADFWGTTFRDANFLGVTFHGNANFMGVTFQDASFGEVTFQGTADFREATFRNIVHFRRAAFRDANFLGATFHGNANFREVTFQSADFREATFQDANFREATIEKTCEFFPAKNEVLDFQYAKFLFRANITADLTLARFHRAYLDNAAFIDCIWPGKIYEEVHMEDRDIELSYNQLETIYRDFKQNMQSHGDYKKAGDFYYREMECRKESMRETGFSFNWIRSLGYSLLKYSCGYGEKPERTILSSFLTIIVFSFLYWGLKCLDCSEEIVYSIYFSFVTFTTLGLGDIKPLTHLGRALICCEAVIGAFLIALFVVVFARKMMR